MGKKANLEVFQFIINSCVENLIYQYLLNWYTEKNIFH